MDEIYETSINDPKNSDFQNTKRKRGRPKLVLSEESIKKQQERYKQKYEKRQEEKQKWKNNVSEEQRQIMKRLEHNVYTPIVVQKIFHIISDEHFKVQDNTQD
jgi:hypothetical protein